MERSTEQSVEELRAQRLRPMELPPLPENPLVSVLIANYNYAHYIGEAIESVLNQTYSNFEIIICDDGSTDDSVKVIQSYMKRDTRIHLIAKQNGGVASALNKAFQTSKGDVIALLDADDSWIPLRLEITMDLFRSQPVPGLVMHPLKVVDENGRIWKDRHPARLDHGWLAERLLSGEYPHLAPASGLSFHRSIAERIFPIPEQLRTWADRLLHERAALLAPAVYTDRVLAIYRQHSANVTGSSGATTIEGVEKVLRQLQLILQARAEFIFQIYGVLPDWHSWYARESARYNLIRDFLEGKQANVREIIDQANGQRPWLWVVLYKCLPRRYAIPLFRWWWGEGIGKRWARLIARALSI